jgi:hypothetical protein
MYFDSKQVNNLLNCIKCEGRLDEPRLLPCGNSICSYCSSSIQLVNNKEFQCLICNELHEMPQKGLPINKLALEMLSCKSINVSRGKSFDSLQQIMIDIQKKQNLFKYRLFNPNDFIKEHFIERRNEVQLATEQFHEQINDINKKLIDEIDEYENKLIDFNINNNLDLESLKYFHDFAQELESFRLKTDNYLKEHSLNDEEITNLNKDALLLKDKTELEILNLRDFILNETFIRFEPNKERISKSILGELKIAKVAQLESIILQETNKVNELMVLCEFASNQKFSLIYRESQDGFEAAKFHAKCDDKPNTFIMIKSENGNVFGGYTEQSWSGNGPKNDSNAFIFSLINKINRPLKIKSDSSSSIKCDVDSGPCFGLMGDLRISKKFDTDFKNYSNFGLYYPHPDFKFGSNEAKNFLAGSEYFQFSEIEVFTKQN